MLHFLITIDNQFFQRSFAECLVVSPFKVSNDLDKHLLDIVYLRIVLESDVHHMTSQFLSILIDFIQNRPNFRIFRPFVVFQIFKP